MGGGRLAMFHDVEWRFATHRPLLTRAIYDMRLREPGLTAVTTCGGPVLRYIS